MIVFLYKNVERNGEQMKRKRENKGITLIALIITIIVMLILVGVSVNVALNGGLFDTAKTATEKTEQATQAEKEFMIYAQLIAEADELAKRYPLNCEVADITVTQPIITLTDDNVVDLYGYILEKYNTTYNNLSLTTAIKAANNFYEIFDKSVQNYQNTDADKQEYIKQNFWKKLTDYRVENVNEDSSLKRLALQFAFLYCKNNPIPTNMDDEEIEVMGNNVKYCILANVNLILETEGVIDQLNTIYPGGHYPTDAITGTLTSDFTYLKTIENIKLLKITEENSNSIIMLGEDGVENGGLAEEFVGKIVYAVPVENDEFELGGILCHNVFVTNTETGEIIYIDDEGAPNKSFL